MKQGGLPSAYQEVEWIGFSTVGPYYQTYIDTGYIFKNDTIIDISARFILSNYGFPISGYTNGVQFDYYFGGGGEHPSLDMTSIRYIQPRYTRDARIVFDMVSGEISDNDVVVASGTPQHIDITGSNISPVWIGRRSNIPVSDLGGALKLRTLIAKDGNKIMRDYVPCYRKSDGVIGIYDLCGSICPLTGTPFYINAGTGTFTKGADVN